MRTSVALLSLTLLYAGRAQGADPGRAIELRLLESGGRSSLLAKIDLDRPPQTEARRYDPQYDAEVWVRGLPLAQILSSVEIPAHIDLALLRFNNGLLIPLAFRDRALMERMRPFVARSAIATAGPFTRLEAGLVEDPRRPPTSEDLRPLRFAGNKLVVADAKHPDVLPSLAGDLRPLVYADSLASIELVTRAAWEHQLEVDPSAVSGLRIYQGSCRFCHAVRGAGGGTLGWDFVEPTPIYSDDWIRRMKQGAHEMNPTPGRTLLGIHVRFRPEGANRSMPALRAMKSDEVKALWTWLQAVAAKPLIPYTPEHGAQR